MIIDINDNDDTYNYCNDDSLPGLGHRVPDQAALPPQGPGECNMI